MSYAKIASVFGLLVTAAAAVGSFAPTRPATAGMVAAPDGPVTTGGFVAMKNLESDLIDAEIRVAEDPTDLRARLRRSNLVYLRARVTGDIDEMARAVTLTDACIADHPSSADAHLLRAVQRQTLHRFADARADLARARALGAAPDKIATLERELDWNAGEAAAVAKSVREEAATRPSLASLTRLARLEHDLGRYDAAEAAYARALEQVESRDPIPVAMLEVQRGMNLADAGRNADAERAFRSASLRLPAYTAAKEHLAELLHRMGRDHEATTLYEQITKTSTDPEFMGALAALYREHGRVADADRLRARAVARYDELLAKYPDAMAWHAAEFFAGEGKDEARALSLLRKNADLRPNAESFEALARLERSHGNVARADELARRAEAIREAARAQKG